MLEIIMNMNDAQILLCGSIVYAIAHYILPPEISERLEPLGALLRKISKSPGGIKPK